jgi:hypothetical protein
MAGDEDRRRKTTRKSGVTRDDDWESFPRSYNEADIDPSEKGGGDNETHGPGHGSSPDAGDERGGPTEDSPSGGGRRDAES